MALALSQRIPHPAELIRIFDDDAAEMGDKWDIALVVSLAADVATVYGLQNGITHKRKNALVRLLRDKGAREMRWCHTNNNGHTVAQSFLI